MRQSKYHRDITLESFTTPQYKWWGKYESGQITSIHGSLSWDSHYDTIDDPEHENLIFEFWFAEGNEIVRRGNKLETRDYPHLDIVGEPWMKSLLYEFRREVLPYYGIEEDNQ